MDHSWGYASDQRLRDENQDCHGVFEFPDFTLAVVCDGMGGHVGGAQASAIAVRTIHDTLREHDGTNDIPAALEQALTRANQAIYEAARKNHRLMGMGTTVVAAAITDNRAYLAHVGDSRCYLLREGQVRQVTRDHTMVNLFVDAELLTPEDAATHPEAHVLSRSLGVERTVDVELTEPVDLQADDVIFLCSDGVHGVITDWELSNVDWGAPHEGIQHVMDIVAAREGDDNATAVAVLLATSFEDVPPTPVPEPDRIGEGTGAAQQGAGVTAVPLDEPESGRTIIPDALADDDGPPAIGMPQSNLGANSPHVPAPMPSQGQSQQGGRDAGGYIVYDEKPEQEPAPAPVPDLRKKQREEEAKGKGDGAKAQGGNRRTVLLVVLALLLVGGGGLTAAAVVGAAMSGGGGGATPPEVAPLEPAPVDEPLVHIEGDDGMVEAADLEEPEDDAFFKPRIPDAPRRIPHRPLEFTQPPPGGPLQWEAVQKARTHECAASLDAVRKGMKASIDHATLYSQSWFCYNEVHQRPLMEADLERWEDFPRLIPHFEGPQEKRDELPDEVKRLPYWFQPAVDGVEHRLIAWNETSQDDRFAPVMIDLLGAPTVTDQLAKDVLLEAQAAVALSKVEDPSDRVVEWWARRVYIASFAMEGRAGRLIEENRPELVEPIRDLIDEAVNERPPEDEEDPKAKPKPVPDMVTRAWETAKGLRDKPDPSRPRARTGPVKPLEPDLDELDMDPATVHRPGELIIESP